MHTTTSRLHMLRTEKQRRFVLAYVGMARFNATEAARLAMYDGSDETLRAIGYENLTKPHIRAAIDEILAEHSISEAQAVALISSHARTSLGDFIDIVSEEVDSGDRRDAFRLNLQRAKNAGVLHLIKKVGYDAHGRPYIELVDAQDALKELLSYYARRRAQSAETDQRADLHAMTVLSRMGIKVN